MIRPVLARLADELTRDQAREAAQRELSRRQYSQAEPPLLVRLLARVLRALGRLFAHAPGLGRGTAGVVLVVLLAVAVGVLLVRFGPLRGLRTAGRAVFDASGTTAAQHRAAAEVAASEGRWADAVRERLRAAFRELEVRGVLDARPGRTAGEVARDGGRAAPALADDLRRAAGVFDEVWYGGRTATPDAYTVLVALDDRVRGARLAPA